VFDDKRKYSSRGSIHLRICSKRKMLIHRPRAIHAATKSCPVNSAVDKLIERILFWVISKELATKVASPRIQVLRFRPHFRQKQAKSGWDVPHDLQSFRLVCASSRRDRAAMAISTTTPATTAKIGV
jgi:hypothetical protein